MFFVFLFSDMVCLVTEGPSKKASGSQAEERLRINVGCVAWQHFQMVASFFLKAVLREGALDFSLEEAL